MSGVPIAEPRATGGSSTDAQPLDRRRHGRRPVVVPLSFRSTFSLPRGESGTGIATDLADDGVQLRTNRPVDIGEWVRLDWSPSLGVRNAMPEKLRSLDSVKARVVRSIGVDPESGALPYAYGAQLATGRRGMALAFFDLVLPWIGLLLILATAIDVGWLRGSNLYYFWYHPLVNLYSLLISGYILSRIALACVYRSPRDAGLRPPITVAISCKNEEGAIRETLECIYRSDYPAELMQVIAVDDGSTDGTWAEMERVRDEHPDLELVRFETNRGKRQGMAAAARLATGDIVVYVDSDSFVRRDAFARIVQGFADPEIGAVCGHGTVANPGENFLTKMQEVRYYVAFRIVKSAESLFDTVTCCSGCLAAYRRSYMMEVLDVWLDQKFLGKAATFGDDRSLTNFMLRRSRVIYDATAICATIVPATLSQFFRQQLRWKKSWIRESLLASTFMWKRHPLAAFYFYLGVIFPFVSPAVVFIALVLPLLGAGTFSYLYAYGTFLMALLYGLVYLVRYKRAMWIYGLAFSLFYMMVLVWQTYYALATVRRNHWGTRQEDWHARARSSMTRENVFKSRTFVRDRRTWIATLLAGAALWAGTSAWLNRHVALAARRAAGPDEDGRLVTLAFDRVVAVPDGIHLDRSRLRDFLHALSRAGWQSVTLGEVRAAFAFGARLPAKPVLLTFDEGYLSTYEAADPVLRELHWPGVMFLRTERQDRRDVSFLFWDRLKRMTGSGIWAVASGDPPDGIPPRVPGTLPPRPPGARRIASRLGIPEVVAWAPRGVDPLVVLGCEDAPRDGVAWLGFADDVAGAAPPDGNPFRIPRLRVAPSWTTAELISRMDRAVASPRPRSPAGRPAPLGDGWIAGEGTATQDGASLRLAGAPRAEVWIPAARWVDDWELTARIVPGEGEFWLVQPEAARSREWRIGGAGGNLYVEVRTPGRPPEVLAKATGVATRRKTHTLSVIKRGRGIRAVWDGTPISAGPIALPGRWHGKVGLVAYGGAGTASLSVSELRFSAYPYSVRTTSASPDAAEVHGLAREAETIAAISPPWARVDVGRVSEQPLDRDLLRILSRKFAWDVLPSIAARGGAPDDPAAWASSLARRAAEERFDGLSLHIEDVSSEAGEAWSTTAKAVEQALRRSGMRLLVTRRPAVVAGTR